MPRTMLSDEHWLKLKPILRDLNVYNKRNLRNVFEGILYRMKTGCQWRDIPECLEKIIVFSSALTDGLKMTAS